MNPGGERNRAWSDYWNGQKTGCLPESSPALEGLFRTHWHSVAKALPARARILDLATGSGSVLKWLGEERTDLERIGVDLADPLPPAPEGCETISGIAIEQLPFADAEFDAVVSQFGFEYGDFDRTADETARVLRPGGALALVTHHAGGPIVVHNRRRGAALAWALDDAKLIERARNLADTPLAAAERKQIEQAPRLAQDRFGPRSPAWEIAESIARLIRQGMLARNSTGLALLDTIERKARGEMQRIAALEAAAGAVAGRDRFVARMAERSLILVDSCPLVHAPDGTTVANYLAFSRS